MDRPRVNHEFIFFFKISVKMAQSSENPPKGIVLTNRDKSYIFYTHMGLSLKFRLPLHLLSDFKSSG